jgi:RNA polymerase sigma-70 factor (ECF subfamily)
MAALAPTRDIAGGSGGMPPGSAGARTPTRSERRLAARLARGDQGALREIRQEYSGVVRGYAQQILGDSTAADDVLQQVMVEVWERGSTFDPARGSLLSWLMTMARSRAIDHSRRRVPEPRDPAATALLIDATATGESATDQLADQWEMAHLLTQIPREEARVLWLRFHGDMSQTEIAEETGMALGTVKMRMVSGLSRLRELMEEEA